MSSIIKIFPFFCQKLSFIDPVGEVMFLIQLFSDASGTR